MTRYDLPLPVQIFLRWVKRIIALCIRNILQVLFFFPVRKNRILISSFSGLGYSCNPKYISEYLIDHEEKNTEIIWGFTHPEKYADIRGIKTVRFNSPAWFYYSATSSVIIANSGIAQAQPKRKGQMLIETWHGGGAYKRVGRGVLYVRTGLEDRILHETVNRVDLFLSSSREFTEYCIWHDFGYGGEVLQCGMPRNDLFFDDIKREAAARRVRNALGISGYIAVYAPTFRGRRSKGYRTRLTIPYQDVLSALQKRFEGPAVILKRAHPGGIMVDGAEPNVLDVTDYPDMQELLCAADMLITDYSSCIWDFALLGRPCLLFMPDLEDYTAARGLCTPPTEWPGIVCGNEEELISAISSIDVQACAERAARHLQAMGSYENGTATEQVCERILKHVGKRDLVTDETA